MEVVQEQECAEQRTEIRITSVQIVATDDGRLTEDPELLTEVGLLRTALARTFKHEAKFDSILVEPGAYVIPVRWKSTQMEIDLGEDAIAPFVRTLTRCRDQLEANAESDHPCRASDLGLTEQLVRTAGLQTKVEKLSDGVFVRDPCSGTNQPLVAADPESFSALPKPAEIRRPVDGVATAAGPGTAAGARLEINKTAMYVVPGLTFEEAISLVRENTRVSGKSTIRDHELILEEVEFHVQPKLPI